MTILLFFFSLAPLWKGPPLWTKKISQELQLKIHFYLTINLVLSVSSSVKDYVFAAHVQVLLKHNKMNYFYSCFGGCNVVYLCIVVWG